MELPVRSGWVCAAGQTGDSDLVTFTFRLHEEADETNYSIRFRNVAAYSVNSEPFSAKARDSVIVVDAGQVPVQWWMLY